MVRLLFFGDFVAKHPERIVLSNSLIDLLASSDINVCNFEAPVEVNVKPQGKSGPSLFQSSLSPTFLEDNGFNVILLANNHLMDYGDVGCLNTIRSFKKSVLVGAGPFDDAYSIQVKEVCGLKIGFLSLVQHEFGVHGNNKCLEYGVAWISHPKVKDTISSMRDSIDFLFVCPHAGVEFLDAPLPEWRDFYRRMIDWGADAIIASHPHVPQGWEVYNGKYIFYSLGNFYFDVLSGNKFWNTSIVVEVLIEDSINVKIHPLSFSDDHIVMDFSSDAQLHLKYINDLLSDRYLEYIDNQCTKLLPDYKYSVLSSLSGISFRDLSFSRWVKLLVKSVFCQSSSFSFLNILQCESHRWLVERALKIKENAA